MHYYKFNIADWGLSTAHLSLEEEASYFRLINHYYDTESPIPLETQSVFRRLRLASQEKATSILNEFFEKTDSGWIHPRCEKILKEYRKTSKKNKVNGLKGGRPKKGVAYSETQDKPSGLPNESQNNPNQEPLTKNHKPITNNHLSVSDKPKRKSRLPPDFILDDHKTKLACDYWLSKNRQDLTLRASEIFDQFISHANANGKAYANWDAAWTTWYTNAVKFERLQNANGNGNYQPRLSRAEKNQAVLDEFFGGKGRVIEGAYEHTGELEPDSDPNPGTAVKLVGGGQ